MNRFQLLIRHVERWHAGQTDLAGVPYIQHLFTVARTVQNTPPIPGIDLRVVALCHDTLEDTSATISDLATAGLNQDEIATVILLTRPRGTAYDEYIEQLVTAPLAIGDAARRVKIADLEHNLGRLTPELERLRARYTQALERLAS